VLKKCWSAEVLGVPSLHFPPWEGLNSIFIFHRKDWFVYRNEFFFILFYDTQKRNYKYSLKMHAANFFSSHLRKTHQSSLKYFFLSFRENNILPFIIHWEANLVSVIFTKMLMCKVGQKFTFRRLRRIHSNKKQIRRLNTYTMRLLSSKESSTFALLSFSFIIINYRCFFVESREKQTSLRLAIKVSDCYWWGE